MKSEVIRLRINADLLEVLRNLAEKEYRPLSKHIELLLKKALEEK